jgi:monoamine oxidase
MLQERPANGAELTRVLHLEKQRRPYRRRRHPRVSEQLNEPRHAVTCLADRPLVPSTLKLSKPRRRFPPAPDKISGPHAPASTTPLEANLERSSHLQNASSQRATPRPHRPALDQALVSAIAGHPGRAFRLLSRTCGRVQSWAQIERVRTSSPTSALPRRAQQSLQWQRSATVEALPRAGDEGGFKGTPKKLARKSGGLSSSRQGRPGGGRGHGPI